MRYRRSLLPSAILVIALSAISCHRPVTITTPAGVTAWNADQAVLRINELEDAAIAAEANHGISRHVAHVLVEYSVSADRILKVTPKGWQATLKASWAVAKEEIGPQTNQAIAAAIAAVDAILQNLPL